MTTRCVHLPPSPGQSMCQCGHQRIELQFARWAAARAARERLTRTARWALPASATIGACAGALTAVIGG